MKEIKHSLWLQKEKCRYSASLGNERSSGIIQGLEIADQILDEHLARANSNQGTAANASALAKKVEEMAHYVNVDANQQRGILRSNFGGLVKLIEEASALPKGRLTAANRLSPKLPMK